MNDLMMLPPFLPLLLGALAAILLRGWVRNILMLLAPILGALPLVVLLGLVILFAVRSFVLDLKAGKREVAVAEAKANILQIDHGEAAEEAGVGA